MPKYRLTVQIMDRADGEKFIISTEGRDDDEAIRAAQVAADVLLVQHNDKFSIAIEDTKGRSVAIISEGGIEGNFIDRPIKYSEGYIRGGGYPT